MSRIFARLLIVASFGYGAAVTAEEVSREQIKGLDEQVQDVKKDVLAISSELKLLEEKLLYPSNTEVSLFVSLSADENFRLDSVEITLDGKTVAHHIYSFKELEALRAGGMQRIYTGNVRTGGHELVVGLIADKDYKTQASYQLEKGVGPGFVEISLSGPGVASKSIQFKDW